jgi:hypothetical protein
MTLCVGRGTDGELSLSIFLFVLLFKVKYISCSPLTVPVIPETNFRELYRCFQIRHKL